MARALLPVGVVSVKPVTFRMENGLITNIVCHAEFPEGLVQVVDIYPQLTDVEKTQAQNLFNSISQAITNIFV